MKKEVNLHEVRNRFVENNRRQEHMATFKEHRQAATQQMHALLEQEFNSIYPNIDEDSFSKHLPFLNKFAILPQYNYRLVIFGPYLYDHLLENHNDTAGLFLLEILSQYEELELPQTEELTSVLVHNLENYLKSMLTIISNLLNNHRYSSCLRDLLIDEEIIPKIQKALEKAQVNTQNQSWIYLQTLYFRILCAMISSHPIVSLNHFHLCLHKAITSFCLKEEQLSLLFSTIGALCGSMAPDKQRANLLYAEMESLMLKQYYGWEEDITIIVEYCLRTGVTVSSKFGPLLISSLTSSIPQLPHRIVRMLTFLQQQEQLWIQVQPHRIMEGLLNCFSHSQTNAKVDIFGLLTMILPQYMDMFLGHSAMVIEGNYLEHIHQLMPVLKESIHSHSLQLRSASITTLHTMIVNSHAQFVLGIMQQQSLLQELSALDKLPSQDVEKVQQILSISRGEL